jgi:hypothetical protein
VIAGFVVEIDNETARRRFARERHAKAEAAARTLRCVAERQKPASVPLRRLGNPNAPPDVVAALRTHARVKDLVLYVGDGWLPLVSDCHKAVMTAFPNYELLAVKQRFGELAFQACPVPWRGPDTWTEDERRRLDDIVEQFREQSRSVCEECGRGGEDRSIHGYELVLCDECYSALSQ